VTPSRCPGSDVWHPAAVATQRDFPLRSVLADGGHVSKAAVTRFHEVISKFANYGGYSNNNRPVQPLNGRVVKLRHAHNRHHH
jgi:hypothetical protein